MKLQAHGRTWQVSPDLMVALNAQGCFETSNPAWMTILGWSEEEVAQHSVFALLHLDDVETTRAGFNLTLVGQPAIRFPNRYRCKDGSYRWISWTGVSEDGMVYCMGRVIARIFDPFYTTKPLGQGTGLGLSMVYGFVHQSGGQVRVDSELGQGTSMCLYLPRYTGDAAVEERAAVEAEIEVGDGETIVLIEDEPAIRSFMGEMLKESGYRVLGAENGPLGLEILKSAARVDLLVTDVGLPGGMNGRQVADSARVLRPGLKVLFVTGYADNAALANGLLEPGMSVLTKPFDARALLGKVQAIVSQRSG